MHVKMIIVKIPTATCRMSHYVFNEILMWATKSLDIPMKWSTTGCTSRIVNNAYILKIETLHFITVWTA